MLTLVNISFPSLLMLLECGFLPSILVSSESSLFLAPMLWMCQLGLLHHSGAVCSIERMADFETDPDVRDSAPSLIALAAFPPLSCLFLLMWVSLSNFLHKIQKDNRVADVRNVFLETERSSRDPKTTVSSSACFGSA